MYLSGGIVVEGQSYIYGYAFPLPFQYYMRNGQYLTGNNHPIYHSIIFNYTQDMISCYAALSHFLEPRAWTTYLSIAVVVQGHWYMYIYANPMLYECYMRHEKCLTGNHHPIDHSMISTYTQVILRGKALSGTRSLNYAPQKWHSGPRTMVDIYICYPTGL